MFLTLGSKHLAAQKALELAVELLGEADATLIFVPRGFIISGVSPIGHLGQINCFTGARLQVFSLLRALPKHRVTCLRLNFRDFWK